MSQAQPVDARFDEGQLHSTAFREELLDIARDVVTPEKDTRPRRTRTAARRSSRGYSPRSRLTRPSVYVKCVVNNIDQTVQVIPFPGWQHTLAGEGEVEEALRADHSTYKLHSDAGIPDMAYGYITQGY